MFKMVIDNSKSKYSKLILNEGLLNDQQEMLSQQSLPNHQNRLLQVLVQNSIRGKSKG